VVLLHLLLPSFGNGHEKSIYGILQSFFLIPDKNIPILSVAWTLKHELYFYLLFGLTFLLIRNRYISYSIIGLWVTLTLFFTVNPQESWNILVFLFNSHNLEFFSGVVIAYLTITKKTNQGVGNIFSFLGIVSMILVWVIEYFGLLGINRVFSWGIPSAILIYGLVNLDLSQKVKNNKVLLFLGDASYSIYLTHTLAIYFCILILNEFRLFEVFGPQITVTLCIIFTVVSTCLFYIFVEKPVLGFLRDLLNNNKYSQKGKSNLTKSA
jgi:exopolysaccharide production protein ExoZ